jgi:nucleotide-binding universal stress UspA family protein
MVEIKKILFPVDFSESTQKVFPYVLAVVEKYKGKLILMYVAQDLAASGMYSFVPHPSAESFTHEVLSGAKKAMDEMCENQADALKACPGYEKKIVTGDPATEIIKTIESENVDLVIMGTHGRKGLEHTIFGSVAENVVRKSPVPVMTVNPYKVKS